MNGVAVQCGLEDTILTASKKAGIRIPTLCHDDRLEPYGGCRLCIVEGKGGVRALPSCTTAGVGGEGRRTGKGDVWKVREGGIALLVVEHPKGCVGGEAT
ncbi:(2Fe-2S)-binding protein, partial [bacterium]|nr:(2Fe-2S)-binding protein [bacterium]